MESDTTDNMSFNPGSTHTKAAAAMSTWSIEELERGVKEKMEANWSQVESSMRAADVNRSGALSPVELRDMLEKFCFALPDQLFDDLYARLPHLPNGEVSINQYLDYFRGMEDTSGKLLAPPMTADKAASFIASRIEESLSSGNGGLLQAYKMFDRDRSGGISHKEFLKQLQGLFLIRVAPALVGPLMHHYDPENSGSINYTGFAKRVMASATSIAGGAATSFGNHEVEDPQGNTTIHRRWGFEEVEGCLRQRLQGDSGRRVVEALNSCDVSRDGRVHTSEIKAVLKSEDLDMTSAQFAELFANFEVDATGHMPWADFVAAFVTSVDREAGVDIVGDPAWEGLSLETIKAVIRERVYNRIGEGPEQYRRTWKYFSAGKEGTLDLASFGRKLTSDLNIRLSANTLQELLVDLGGEGGTIIDFKKFVTRVLGSAPAAGLSLGKIEGNAGFVSHIEGNSNMMIRRKVQESVHGLSSAFKRADMDKTGSLTPNQLDAILRRHDIDLNPVQFQQLLMVSCPVSTFRLAVLV
jgi:Ca2+-binding EF-hand superfamily protein